MGRHKKSQEEPVEKSYVPPANGYQQISADVWTYTAPSKSETVFTEYGATKEKAKQQWRNVCLMEEQGLLH